MKQRYNFKNPYIATLKDRVLLNKEGSNRKTYHIVLDISENCLQFVPGNSAAIIPTNPFSLADKTLSAMKVEKKDNSELLDFLLYKANISRITNDLFSYIEKKQKDEKKKLSLQKLLNEQNKELYKIYIDTHEVWDFLEENQEADFSIEDICKHLLPLLPRFYSIASSQTVSPKKIDLIVSHLTYNTSDKIRYGICSHFLCSQAKIGDTIPLYIHSSHNFLLPKDNNLPIIMIAAGTGIAPFRAFIQERARHGIHNKQWLFFGEQYRKYDFYYEDFLEEMRDKNFLKLDLAFSRDQKDKIYVQHLLEKNGYDVWQWIEKGSYIYICGNATKMASDVEKTLIKIMIEYGQLNKKEAIFFLKNMKKQKHLLKDVY